MSPATQTPGTAPAGHALRRGLKRPLRLLAIIAGLAAAAWLSIRWSVAALDWKIPLPPGPEVLAANRLAIRTPNHTYVTRVATLHDELFAYLMYEYFQRSDPFQNRRLLLSYAGREDAPEYRIDLELSDDFISAVQQAAELSQAGKIERYDWELLPSKTLQYRQNQTRIFVSAYNLPVRKKMEDLSEKELRALLRRFIRFKSTTDPRIRKRMESAPKPLAPGEAQQIAADIVDVAQFYNLPLDIFLGIGAMENNYLDVRGDLKNSIWKAKPAKDDIVLERRKGRVRVLNDSAGRWQITRETLRYAHQLYLQDKRDYLQLPPRLRPPRELDINNVDPDVLTTYAGLILRDLLDHFHGDVSLAVGAYNGGASNPNMRYMQGVEAAAAHARSVLERAAALNGESVMHMRWVVPR